MSAQPYRTRQGDTVDYIAWKQYENQNPGTVEAIFLANPILCQYDDILPAGLVITLPDLPTVQPTKTVTLWS